ncbi:hypothetical protein RFI_36587 [Reticulomyxa filosa]|uniref:Caspase family p20 domain-containing protein n=1 Tax=Reticulomyxa filosa TaxID=46433 RepID=X6LHK9_RETFI|nr:hypothetical protein RFI_36587 [Reticulomyxa filosa]|eukprot:ETO00851.1 hypothetical protein RFI_36587 [Reticulomyxa filosa]
MIAISKYGNQNDNIPSIENDVKNFMELFKTELNYTFVRIPLQNTKKTDLLSFLQTAISDFSLHDNKYKYDGLILIVCGHGYDGLVVSCDKKLLSIDWIISFACDKMIGLRDLPKIFIIDTCRTKCDQLKMQYKSLCSLNQMLQDVKKELRSINNGEFYCVESQDTTYYDIIFNRK